MITTKINASVCDYFGIQEVGRNMNGKAGFVRNNKWFFSCRWFLSRNPWDDLESSDSVGETEAHKKFLLQTLFFQRYFTIYMFFFIYICVCIYIPINIYKHIHKNTHIIFNMIFFNLNNNNFLNNDFFIIKKVIQFSYFFYLYWEPWAYHFITCSI